MTAPRWREEPIGRNHDRAGFDCGSAGLNEYLQRYARQNHQSGGAKTFVAVPSEAPTRILAFYTISPGAIEFARGIRRRKSGPRLTALNGPVTTEGEPRAFAGATGTTKTPA